MAIADIVLNYTNMIIIKIMESLTGPVTIVSSVFIYLLFIFIMMIDALFIYMMLKDKQYKVAIACIAIFIVCSFIIFAQTISLLPHG